MWYLCARVLIMVLLIGTCLFLFNKKILKTNKKVLISVTVFLVIIYQLIWRIPFENVFLRFSTVEQAFGYSYKSQILNITPAADNISIITFGGKDGIDSAKMKRDNRGWKIRCPETIFENEYKSWRNVLTGKIKLSECNKYYINVIICEKDYPNGISISDNRGSKFDTLKIIRSNGTLIIYYTFVSGNLNDYYFTIDGNKVGMKDLT